jgi:AcrR family transcriptional regulator
MSPRTREQVEEMRTRSRDLILEAALELFAHQGFHGTTISQIARNAGISKGLMYNYFTSKEDLLKGILDQAQQTGDPVFATMNDPGLDPQAALELAIDQIFELLEANPTYWRLIMALSFKEDISSQYEALARRSEMQNLQYLTSLLERTGFPKPEMESMYLAAVLDGILLHFLHFKEKYPLREMREFLKNKIRAQKI